MVTPIQSRRGQGSWERLLLVRSFIQDPVEAGRELEPPPPLLLHRRRV